MLVDPLYITLNKLRLLESSSNLINETWGDLSLDEKQALDNLIKNKIMPRVEKEPELRMLVDRYNALKKDTAPEVTTDKADPAKVKKFQELIDKAKKGGQTNQPEKPEVKPPKPEVEPPKPEVDPDVVEPENIPSVDPKRVEIIVKALNSALDNYNPNIPVVIKAFTKLKSAEEWYAVEKSYNEQWGKQKPLREKILKRTEKADRIQINSVLRRLKVSEI